jgi:formylglycine-generating enzyme required for sulfatase activity
MGAPPQDEAVALQEPTTSKSRTLLDRFLGRNHRSADAALHPTEPSYDWEHPQHLVVIREGYWLFDTPVTQGLYEAVLGENPSEFRSADRPVERVSWEQAQTFIETLNRKLPGLALRLPSEAEWEYACRAGTREATYAGALEILGERNAPALNDIAWYGGNSGVEFDLETAYDSSNWSEKQFEHNKAGTRSVKLKKANAWGLYDMLGNVLEWCEDHWHDNYNGAPHDGSAWLDKDTSSAASRVIRGGSWHGYARHVRSAYRHWYEPQHRTANLGFRCARGHSEFK